jgi:hypothetical protein
MKWIVSAALVGLLSLTVSSPERFIPQAFSVIRAVLAAPATSMTPPAGHGRQEVVWRTGFSDPVGGSIEGWRQAKGFRLEQGAQDKLSEGESAAGPGPRPPRTHLPQ